MTNIDFKKLVGTSDYDFLRNNKNLGDNICMLVLGGSYAYGTNVEDSDVDVRGFAIEDKAQILAGKPFEQVIDNKTDTTIYGFKKLVNLLTKCNPNIIEMLGCREQDYIYKNDIANKLIENKDLFISKQAFFTFSGYASAQMKRLASRCKDSVEINSRRNSTIENAIENSLENILSEKQNRQYLEKKMFYSYQLPENGSDDDKLCTETVIDVDALYIPIKDMYDIIGSIYNTINNFAKEGKHNREALKYDKVNKHAMHLLRLYMMVIDILNNGEVITYREKEHDLLMSIRNGEYQYIDTGNLKPEFFELVKKYEDIACKAFDESKLPDKADVNKIDKFLIETYEEYLF